MFDIKFPEKKPNRYYEYDSADGFAFYGAALAIRGNDYKTLEKCKEAVKERNCSLNAPQKILNTNVSAQNKYVYTLWSCAELFHHSGDRKALREVATILDKIGIYPSGMFRYCSEEIYYMVPNVTSAAALVYAMIGDDSKVYPLLDTLRENQKSNGNWNYGILNNDYKYVGFPRQEDCYHVAMMTYHLREIEKWTGFNTSEMVENCVKFLSPRNTNACSHCKKFDSWSWLCPGTIGWGVPMMYLATKGLVEKDKENEAYKMTVEYLKHRNFRVRAIAAWALTEDRLMTGWN